MTFLLTPLLKKAPAFPITFADLSLKDSHNLSLYANLKSIHKSTLSIPNRLTSILEDAEFAKEVSLHHGLPLVPNERCGSWYADPVSNIGSAYFKSTDGHHGQWDFSARRLNLQLPCVLDAYGGAIVVDSTRRGKNLPDAFSKTAPKWVAVLNRALFPEVASMHRLQVPPAPDKLGPSEISQIEVAGTLLDRVWFLLKRVIATAPGLLDCHCQCFCSLRGFPPQSSNYDTELPRFNGQIPGRLWLRPSHVPLSDFGGRSSLLKQANERTSEAVRALPPVCPLMDRQ